MPAEKAPVLHSSSVGMGTPLCRARKHTIASLCNAPSPQDCNCGSASHPGRIGKVGGELCHWKMRPSRSGSGAIRNVAAAGGVGAKQGNQDNKRCKNPIASFYASSSPPAQGQEIDRSANTGCQRVGARCARVPRRTWWCRRERTLQPWRPASHWNHEIDNGTVADTV